MLDALERGDADRAAALMLHHIDHIEAELDLKQLRERGLREALTVV